MSDCQSVDSCKVWMFTQRLRLYFRCWPISNQKVNYQQNELHLLICCLATTGFPLFILHGPAGDATTSLLLHSFVFQGWWFSLLQRVCSPSYCWASSYTRMFLRWINAPELLRSLAAFLFPPSPDPRFYPAFISSANKNNSKNTTSGRFSFSRCMFGYLLALCSLQSMRAFLGDKVGGEKSR